jgi:TonB family protein
MIAAWMIFGFVVTLLLALAGIVVERAAREAGWSALRWIWAVGMAGSLLVVALSIVSSQSPAPTLPAAMDGTAVLSLEAPPPGPPAGPVLLTVAEGGWLDRMDRLALATWGGLTLLLALRFGLGFVRLRRRVRSWPEVTLAEGKVLLSQDTGPALLGLFRRRVVLPRWCLGLDDLHRELIVAHETEHSRSRDTLLLTGGWGVLLLFPWNLPFWWMYRRLREAVELDCDARVTRRYPAQRRRYGELLLLVGGQRIGPGPLPLATFSERPSTLGRRIDMLTRTPNAISRPRTFLLVGGGILLVAGACLLPGPDRTDSLMGPGDDAARGSSASMEAAPDPSEGPTFTPFTVAPEVINRAEVGRALEAEYPQLLRDAGVGGTTLLHFFIDAEGVVGDVRVAEESGHPALDAAALRAASAFRFTPAMNRTERVPVWIQLPITFQTRAGNDAAQRSTDPGDREATLQALRQAQEAGMEELRGTRDEAPVREADAALEAGPTFTPFTVAPEVVNRAEIGDAIEAEYPALLRGAGVGGHTLVHVLIDATGTLRDVQVATGSGHPALDDAALRVARTMEFTPAQNRGEPVPVWIQIPIRFQPD